MTRYAINVIEREDGAILLLKRRSGAQLGPGLWAFCGGHIERDEVPLAAARRELHEELGATCRVQLLGTISPVPSGKNAPALDIHLFHWRWMGGSIQLNHEHSAYSWQQPATLDAHQLLEGVLTDLQLLGLLPGPTDTREQQ